MEEFIFLPGCIIGVFLLAYIVRTCKHSNRDSKEARSPDDVQDHRPTQSDQNSVYNISSRVQGQSQQQYPDGYLSAEHINELNKPPKYDDAPPTYEEAIKLAMAHSNSIQTFQAEQQQQQQQNNAQSSSSSGSTTSVTAPVPVHRTTE